MKDGSVILVETNGSDPEVTTQLRGKGVNVISIDWDEIERGDEPYRSQYIRDILERIDELGVADVKPPMHVGMPEIVRQLKWELSVEEE